MSMYTHATTRAHILLSENKFQSSVHLHSEELYDFVINLVMQQLFIAAAATAAAWVYMHAAVRLSSGMAVVVIE
jgi:hypothetical protein